MHPVAAFDLRVAARVRPPRVRIDTRAPEVAQQWRQLAAHRCMQLVRAVHVRCDVRGGARQTLGAMISLPPVTIDELAGRHARTRSTRCSACWSSHCPCCKRARAALAGAAGARAAVPAARARAVAQLARRSGGPPAVGRAAAGAAPARALAMSLTRTSATWSTRVLPVLDGAVHPGIEHLALMTDGFRVEGREDDRG